MPRVKVIEQPALVFAGTDANMPVAQVPVGGEVQLGSVKNRNGLQWVEVSLPDGRRGYMPGDAKVFSIKAATLLQDEVYVHMSPSSDSPVVNQFRRNARFDLTDQVNGNGGVWVRVRDAGGNEGFIDGKTRVSTGPDAATQREIGLKNMKVGGLWCLGGIAITAITYSAASDGGGTYFVMWGPVIFGGWQFLKGLFQYLGA